jgi:hypothetical protein
VNELYLDEGGTAEKGKGVMSGKNVHTDARRENNEDISLFEIQNPTCWKAINSRKKNDVDESKTAEYDYF